MMRSSGNRPSSIGSQHTRAIQKSSRSDEIEAAIPEQSDLALEVHINRATTLMRTFAAQLDALVQRMLRDAADLLHREMTKCVRVALRRQF